MFGLSDTLVSQALRVMCIVPDRTAQTLLPIITCHVRPGSEIHSDQWAAYNSVQQLQPVNAHHIVNPTPSILWTQPPGSTHKP